MKFLLILTSYPKSIEEELKSCCKKINLSIAAEHFQMSLIDGFVRNDVDFSVISFPMLPSFPQRYKKLYTQETDYDYDGRIVGKMHSFCSLPLIKDYSIRFRLRHAVRNWIKKNISGNEQFAVITYTPTSYLIEAVSPLKKHYHNMLLATVVTELVDFTYMAKANQTFLKSLQQKRERKRVWANYPNIDKYVLLTKQMEERIPQAVGNSMIVEGIYSGTPYSVRSEFKTEKTVVYTGALQEYVGIKELVDAFMLIKDPELRLVICGHGSSANYIKERARIDKRIYFKGPVKRDEAVELQARASVLVNPRMPSQDFTKYSFPSKTMEYLASGTPVIGYMLPGIPEEYREHLYVPNEASVKGLSDKITEVLHLDKLALIEHASKAQDFILQNKTAEKQVKRIIEFLEK